MARLEVRSSFRGSQIMNCYLDEGIDKVLGQPAHDPVPHHGGDAEEAAPQQQGLEVAPFDAGLFEARLVRVFEVRGFVHVRDVLEVEGGFLLQSVFAVDDDGPEDFAEGLTCGQ